MKKKATPKAEATTTVWAKFLSDNSGPDNAALVTCVEAVLQPDAVAGLKTARIDATPPFASDAEFLEAYAVCMTTTHSIALVQGTGNMAKIVLETIRFEKVPFRAIEDALKSLEARAIDSVRGRMVSMPTPPRAIRVTTLLGLTEQEVQGFLYVLVMNVVPWVSARNLSMLVPAVGRYMKMTPHQFMCFCSEERNYFRQGILAMSESRTVKSSVRDREMRIQHEAAAALCGVMLSEAELLKLENTAVATVLAQDGIVFGETPKVATLGSDSDEEEEDEEEEPAKRVKRGRDGDQQAVVVAVPPGLALPEEAYTADIEYLDDQFKYISTLIRLRTLETDMKDEDQDVISSRQKTESQLREMQGRERLWKLKIDRKMAKSLAAGFVPRAEALSKAQNLSSFEKLVLLLLVGNSISHDILIAANGKYVMRGDTQRECTVGYILFVLCDGLQTRVKQRESFQRTSTLVREGFVAVTVRGYGGSMASSACDLSDCLVDIDRKLVDHITGLTTSFTDIVDGSALYTPNVVLEQVVLPPEALEKVQRTIAHFDQYVECRTRIGFTEIGHQGLVMMFCGPSGTGKTMLANAIGHKMGKRILLVNVMQYQQSGRQTLASTDLFKFVFREARLHNAIVFFDECEAFFEAAAGVNPLVLSLLVELERYSGLVILATNNPQLLHEAMHRRITLCIEFRLPNQIMRSRIWQGHIPAKLRVAPETQFSSLAMNFELSGGLIRNAVLSAISVAVAREGTSDPLVTHDDFVEGAKLQLRGAYSAAVTAGDNEMVHIIPKRNIANLFMDPPCTKSLWDMVRLIKCKNTLLSSWGFDHEEHSDQLCGFVALFYGPPGCGKSSAAEGVALECGITVRISNISELLIKHHHGISNQIESLFTEARKQNAMIVLDEAERLLDHSEGALELSQLLQYYVSRYPRPVIVMLRTDRAEVDLTGTNLRFTCQIRFTIPGRAVRKELWRRSLPAGVNIHEDVDFDVLSERAVCGGVIRNVCFLACAKSAADIGMASTAADRVITMKKLMTELDNVVRMTHERTPYRNLFV